MSFKPYYSHVIGYVCCLFTLWLELFLAKVVCTSILLLLLLWCS